MFRSRLGSLEGKYSKSRCLWDFAWNHQGLPLWPVPTSETCQSEASVGPSAQAEQVLEGGDVPGLKSPGLFAVVVLAFGYPVSTDEQASSP